MDKPTVLRSLGLVTLGKALGQVLSWAVTIVVMRWLTPADYGLAATVFATVALLTAFSEYVLINQLVRHAYSIGSMQRAYEGFAVVLALISVVVLLTVGAYYGTQTGKESLQTGMLLICLLVLVLPLRIGPEAHLLRTLQYGIQVKVTLSASVAGAVMTLIAAAAGAGFLALLLGPLVKEIALCAGYRLRVQTAFLPKFSLPRLHLVLQRSKRLMLSEFLVHAGAALPILLYSQAFTVTEIGYFTTASYWALVPLSKVMNVVNQVALPVLSKIRRESGNLRTNQIETPARLMILVSAMSYGALAFLSEPFVSVLIGEQWLPMATLLAIFCLSMPLRALRAFMVSPLQAESKDNALLKMQLIQVACSWAGAMVAFQLPFEALTPIHVAMAITGTCSAILIGWRALAIPQRVLLHIVLKTALIASFATAAALVPGQTGVLATKSILQIAQASIYALAFVIGTILIDPMIREGLKSRIANRRRAVS